MNSPSKVSVIIPCYNVENTINETLDSVLSQTYKNIEIVVIDDGSSDGTSKIIQSYADKFGHITVIVQENKGLPASRNVGVEAAHGSYLVFLDGDDKLHPSYIEKCYEKFRAEPQLDLVYTLTELFEAQTGLFALAAYSYGQLLVENCIPATAMIKASQFRGVGMYDVSLNLLEDWELWIRYLHQFPNVFQIQEPLFFYRKRWSKDSMTDKNVESRYALSQEVRLKIYRKHYAIYTEYGYGLEQLFQSVRNERKFRQKYYGVWYRKLFYQLRNKSK